jgi:hypothetical protein
MMTFFCKKIIISQNTHLSDSLLTCKWLNNDKNM